ncbi:MAG: hypothetical protein U1F43_34610 [Myxococcota bacterium]
MFNRPGYSWDVGVHAVGEVTEHAMTGRLLHRLTDGELQWASLGGVYDEFHWPGDFRIDFPDSPEKFRANLTDAFPAERQAIDKYLDDVRDVAKAMRSYYLARCRRPSAASPRSSWRGARRRRSPDHEPGHRPLTSNAKLRAVLCSQWATLRRAAVALVVRHPGALVTKHFMHGGYYPVGGASEIARTL